MSKVLERDGNIHHVVISTKETKLVIQLGEPFLVSHENKTLRCCIQQIRMPVFRKGKQIRYRTRYYVECPVLGVISLEEFVTMITTV